MPRSVRPGHATSARSEASRYPEDRKEDYAAGAPLDNAIYSVERSAVTSLRAGRKQKTEGRRTGCAPAYRQGSCPVAYRTPETARSTEIGSDKRNPVALHAHSAYGTNANKASLRLLEIRGKGRHLGQVAGSAWSSGRRLA